MKSKGPVDFFLGVFLEFGAAFCLLFFLPHIPWHWLPADSNHPTQTATPPAGITAPERRVLLRPAQPAFSKSRLPLAARPFPQAPALLQPESETTIAGPPPSAPLATNNAPQSRPPGVRRDFPRQYRY